LSSDGTQVYVAGADRRTMAVDALSIKAVRVNQ